MILRISEGGTTLPLGFDGELMIKSLVLSVIPAATCSALKIKSVSSVSINTLFAPVKVTISGNVTQYGFGIRHSSPGFKIVQAALKSACFPPHDATISSGDTAAPNCSP